MDEWMDRWVDIYGWIDGCMEGASGAQIMAEWADGRVDG